MDKVAPGSSRLLEYELWNRINARRLDSSHADAVRALLGRVALVELISPILARALEPFPEPVPTLDALHLAAIEFFRNQSVKMSLASYDSRMLAAARSMRIPIYEV